MESTNEQGKARSKYADIGTITQDELKAIFHYDPETGVFTRIKKHRYPIAGSTKGVENGYVRMAIKRKYYALHRLAWLYVYGCFPKGALDHINGTKTDNRIENLREVSDSQNIHCQRLTKSNTSGFKGVSFKAKDGLWSASIRKDNKTHYLGCFNDPQIAAHAYNKAAISLFGEFACLNPVGASNAN